MCVCYQVLVNKKLIYILLSAGGYVDSQGDQWAHFAIIRYDQFSGLWVFSARQWNNITSSCICQLQGLFKRDNAFVYFAVLLHERRLIRYVVMIDNNSKGEETLLYRKRSNR